MKIKNQKFKVNLKITKGDWDSRKAYTFDKKECISIGRDEDCFIKFPDDDTFPCISRTHCLLDINPPFVTVKDLDSTNGTYLNGELIGKKSESRQFEDCLMQPCDRLRLGNDYELELIIDFPEHCTKHFCDVFPHNDKQLPYCCACNAERNFQVMTIAGYTNISKLGEGGMGEIWIANDSDAAEERVIKFMLPDAQAKDMRKEWFKREISIGQQISHPKIVKQYAIGKLDDCYYLVMEYCRGGNLKDFLNREDLQVECDNNGEHDEICYDKIFWGNSDEALEARVDIAKHIILQVLDGLIYLHDEARTTTNLPAGTKKSCGLIHRDIKPENILLMNTSQYPDIKIADFGLSKAFHLAGLSRNVYTGAYARFHAGDLCFIPSKQVLDYRYALPEVDVWAAAAVFYYMLTGLPPKNFPTNGNMYTVASKKDFVPIEIREPRLAQKYPKLVEVINKALTETPETGIKKASQLKNEIFLTSQ